MRVLAFFLLVAVAEAGADECAALPPPSVTVKQISAPVTVNPDHDYRAISLLSTQEHRTNQRVLGLTRGTARVVFEIRAPAIVDRTRQWECVSPQITMSYGFSPMTVYVAREFPPEGCAYREILQHEQRHVKTYLDHLAALAPELTEALQRRFATGTPARAPVGQTRALLERELQERWMPFVQREMERVRSSQALIDTPEEYRRVSESCGGEILRVVR
ncbi:hypothetical protein [Propionivibrio dicarboxylicus]|uniref:DUF922 domain-containing protein n=1 Tax=Propionivibrio dicarboxylicus TaxID=83767 RepID=A0A1G8JAI7_9RHOO|nr:hypothetical protein [Propionivibrio dicarboxylicus]SDI28196.1 hypothetical protein SAMN05660652_03157 [Propionivibrio dicarboxylicus]